MVAKLINFTWVKANFRDLTVGERGKWGTFVMWTNSNLLTPFLSQKWHKKGVKSNLFMSYSSTGKFFGILLVVTQKKSYIFPNICYKIVVWMETMTIFWPFLLLTASYLWIICHVVHIVLKKERKKNFHCLFNTKQCQYNALFLVVVDSTLQNIWYTNTYSNSYKVSMCVFVCKDIKLKSPLVSCVLGV